MADKYIDLDLTTSGGAGTESDPLNGAEGVAALAALAGDQSGDTYYLKRGTSYIVTASILMTSANNANNFNIRAYGTGARPILDAQANSGFDTILELQNVQNVIIRDIHFKNAYSIGILVKPVTGTVSGVEIYGCRFTDIGIDQLSSVHDAVNIQGSGVTPATGCRFSGNIVNGTGNNGLEISYVDGLIAADNIITGAFFNAFELWEECNNNVFERNAVIDCNRLAWCANQTGQHSGNVFQNNTVVRPEGAMYKDDNSTGTVLYNNSCYMASNVVSSAYRAITINGADAGALITIQNNIIVIGKPVTGTGFCIFFNSANISGATINSNCYHYFSDAGTLTPVFWANGAPAVSGLTDWESNVNTPAGTDSNSTDTDPLYTDPDNGDLTLQAGSPALHETLTEVAGTVVDDINGESRYSGIDAGALQFQRHPIISTSIGTLF